MVMATGNTAVMTILMETKDNASKGIKNVGTNVEALDKSIRGASTRLRGFDARFLSLLFAGMALKRVFGGMFREIVTTFMKAEDHTSGLGRATVRLHAAWEFLKFSIFDALNTDFWIGMIDGVIKMIDWFSQLDEGWRVTFLAITGGLAIVGTGLMLIGQFKLGWDAIMGTEGILKTTGIIHAKTLGSSGVFTLLKDFAIAGIVIKAVFDIDSYLREEMNLRMLIDKLGTDIGLLGVLTHNPWMITIGVSLKLLKFGEEIRKAGQSLTEAGLDRATKAYFMMDETKGDVGGTAKNLGNAIFGAGQAVGGMALSGLGIPFEYINEAIFGSGEKAKSLKETMDSELVPAIEGASDKIAGKENSLVSSLDSAGKQMNDISTVKTDDMIAAADKRISKYDEEISKLTEVQNARHNAFAESLKGFQSEIDKYMSTGTPGE